MKPVMVKIVLGFCSLLQLGSIITSALPSPASFAPMPMEAMAPDFNCCERILARIVANESHHKRKLHRTALYAMWMRIANASGK
ncbi:hypothetical protein KEM48_002370 [Puccinia striiformis f. sp. tritici PST-130]|nr:hypothetical protein KEM48_002370 [Puccinia striiformis f. sp. tritici PST-130]